MTTIEPPITRSAQKAELNNLRERFSVLTAELRDMVWDLEHQIEQRDKLIGYLRAQLDQRT